MSKKNKLMALCVTVLCSQCLHAQPRVMSIGQLLTLADQNSVSLQAWRTQEAAAEEALKAAQAQRLPDISVSATASYWGNGHLWDRNFSNGSQIRMPHFGNNFALEAQQTVYAGGAVSSSIELARLQKQMATLERARNRQDVRFLMLGLYLNLYKQYNQLTVLRNHLKLTRQVLERMHARREQGTALKNDITRYELQQKQLQLQLTQTQNACRIMNHQLSTTLHLPEGTEILPDTLLLDRQIDSLHEKNWQDTAAINHLGLQQAAAGIKISEQLLRLERAARKPQIALVAADHLDGPITIEVPVLDNNFNYWYVGVSLRYSLSSLFKNKHKVQQARLGVTHAEEQYRLALEQVDNAVQENYVNFLTAFTDLQTQQKNVELANENYRLVSHRYENELALLTDLLDAAHTKLNADLSLADARINVLYHYYKMKYITHTL